MRLVLHSSMVSLLPKFQLCLALFVVISPCYSRAGRASGGLASALLIPQSGEFTDGHLRAPSQVLLKWLELSKPAETESASLDKEGFGLASQGEYGISGMEATLSSSGLNYAKDVAVEQVLEEVTPLLVPDVGTSVVTSLGTVTLALTAINLTSIVVNDAAIDLQNESITVFAGGVEANATLKWHYGYAGLWSDSGTADIKVRGMQLAVTVQLATVDGMLNMTVTAQGVHIERLDVSMKGGVSSWLYNWLVDSFKETLIAAVEAALSATVLTSVGKVDAYLQSIPHQFPVDSTASIDATLLSDPVIQPNRLSLNSRAEFVSAQATRGHPDKPAPPFVTVPEGLLCGDSRKMVTLTLTDSVVNSAARVYYEDGRLAYCLDELPASFPVRLNTASWRFIIPALYSKYPNRPMLLDFRTTAPPAVTFVERGLTAEVLGSMQIQVVQEDGAVAGVASVQLAVSAAGTLGLRENNVTGSFALADLQLSLEWSEIGTLPMKALQVVVNLVVKTVVLPMVNHRMSQGFPIPVIPGIALLDASLVSGRHYLLVCTDIVYTGGIFGLPELKEDLSEKAVPEAGLGGNQGLSWGPVKGRGVEHGDAKGAQDMDITRVQTPKKIDVEREDETNGEQLLLLYPSPLREASGEVLLASGVEKGRQSLEITPVGKLKGIAYNPEGHAEGSHTTVRRKLQGHSFGGEEEIGPRREWQDSRRQGDKGGVRMAGERDEVSGDGTAAANEEDALQSEAVSEALKGLERINFLEGDLNDVDENGREEASYMHGLTS
eukprot:TRINITY_DN19274_c0_g4_i1.p1 TRINITY_DN19274_c0_g4~~TRINITY_DN19274_c0_g4_i1.p1  ORF type:complete len:777 (-),score=129.33 TRINITY_DN19274_c0_g4_i1:502-2832(-)